MPKINRVTQAVFAGSATNNGVFGSAQANSGAGTLSNNLATIQGLSAWAAGWLQATLGADKFPCLEEMQAVDYVITTQLAYLFQQGIPEYDTGTTYYQYSMCVKAGTFQIYGSVYNGANVGNALTNPTYWQLLFDLNTARTYFAGGVSTGSANAQAIATSSGNFALTAGYAVSWNAGFSNTGSMTLAVDGTAATALMKNGTSGLVNVVSGDIISGEEFLAIYNGTSFVLQDTNFNGYLTTAAAASTYVPLTAGITAGFINKFRNAGMDINQRTSGTISAAGNAYTTDGWQVFLGGTGTLSWSQTQNVALPNGSYAKNALLLPCNTGLTDVQLIQKIESQLASPLAGQTVTVQFTIANATGSSITPTISTRYPGSADNWGSASNDLASQNLQTITNGATQTVAYTFVASSNARLGYETLLDFAGNLNHASGYIYITNCDIRVTPGATVGLNNNPPSPELRDVQAELALCQRYLEIKGNGTTSEMFASGLFNSTVNGIACLTYAKKRAAPTITIAGLNCNNGSNNYTVTGLNSSTITVDSAALNLAVSGVSTNQPMTVQAAGTSSSITISAEL